MTEPTWPALSDGDGTTGSSEQVGFKRIIRPILVVGVLGFAIHLLLPQVAGLEGGLRAMSTGRWPFLALALVGAGLAYVASAWMVRASVDHPPRWVRTTQVQVAASAAAAVTPMGVGWMAVTQSFLHKEGTDKPTAIAATGLNMALTAVSHIALLLILLPFLPTLHLPTIAPPPRRVWVDATVLLALAVGILYWVPRLRRRAASAARPIIEAIPRVLANPRRATVLVVGAVVTNLAYALGLYGAVAAFGPAPAPFGIVVAYLVAATVASVAPTPGGLGAAETALVAALTRLGVPVGQALAATLSFRVATFWVPLVAGSLFFRRAKRRSWI